LKRAVLFHGGVEKMYLWWSIQEKVEETGSNEEKKMEGKKMEQI
jgi:hypothetical protein